MTGGCLAAVLCCVATPASAVDPETLNVIADFADRICDKIEASGESSDLILEGGADAEINAVLKKLVDIDVSGKAKYQQSEYVGVLREDLAAVMQDSRQCKQEVVRMMQADLAKTSPPVAQDDDVSTNEDTALRIEVLDNDLNVDETTGLVVNLVESPEHGRVTSEGGGAFVYTPPEDFVGEDAFTYSVTSKDGESSSAVVRIAVGGKNDIPVLAVDTVEIVYPFDSPYLLDITGLATDPDDDEIRLDSFSSPDSATQPTRGSDAANELSSALGTLPSERRARAAGMLVLPIDRWVEEAGNAPLPSNFTRTVDYTISDPRGGKSSGSISVQVIVAKLGGLRFRCEETTGPLPRRISYQLRVDDELASERTVNASNAKDWSIGLGHLNMLYPEFSRGRPRLAARWPNLDGPFELACSSELVADGRPLPLAPMAVKGRVGQTETQQPLALDGEALFAPTKAVMEQVYGRPIDW
jgi:hypothetical protein